MNRNLWLKCQLIAISAGLYMCSLLTSSAQATCSTALSDGPTWLESQAHIGDTVHFFVSLDAVNGVCKLEDGVNWVVLPSGDAVQIVDGFAKPLCGAGSAISIQCPGGAECIAAAIPNDGVFFEYTIGAGDDGRVLSFTSDRGTSLPAAFSGIPGFIHVGAVADADAFDCVTGESKGVAAGLGTQPLQIVTPGIEVTKECDFPVGTTCFLGTISIKGTVENTGDIALIDLVVTDDKIGALTVFDLPAGDPARVAITGLAPGQIGYFEGSYSCDLGPTDTVTATAVDTVGGVNGEVSDTAEATCPCVSPCIEVVKDCTDAETCNDDITWTATITNCGDVALENVTATDTPQGGDPVDLVLTDIDGNPLDTPVTLEPGEIAYVEGTTSGAPGDYTDTVEASGTVECLGDAEYTHSDDATCTIPPCPPDICVEKEVACAPAGDLLCSDVPDEDYGETATAVVGDTEGAFCYKITVTNCGEDDLDNVTVVDDLIGAVAGSFPTTLAVDESVTLYFKQSYPLGEGNNPPDSNNYLNTVTANGTGASSGTTVEDTDTAEAIVVPISVECDIVLEGVVENPGGECEAAIESDGPISFTLRITNTGDADLDVTVTGLPTLSDCTVDITQPIPIAAGEFFETTCTTEVTCPERTTFDVTVVGTPNDEDVPCIYDSDGEVVTTESSCDACVECIQEALFCRTTGGGDLIEGTTDELTEPCAVVNTTLYPEASTQGQLLVKVTHGGQMGAPYAQSDECPIIIDDLGNPCIKGQWQHVRHYQGTGNPRDVVSAFHAGGPGKGIFDMLRCECLPCCEESEEGNVPPGWENKDICNPFDHKVCGPLPRPAPANALIWTGIGQMNQASDTGKKPAKYVVVRVYIEDRSEPGGNHPKGAVLPSDIYSFQVWKTDVLVSKKPDYSTVATALRLAVAQASCDFMDDLKSGALPIGTLPDPNIVGFEDKLIVNDQGPLHDGNRQIHPTTSATCP